MSVCFFTHCCSKNRQARRGGTFSTRRNDSSGSCRKDSRCLMLWNPQPMLGGLQVAQQERALAHLKSQEHEIHWPESLFPMLSPTIKRAQLSQRPQRFSYITTAQQFGTQHHPLFCLCNVALLSSFNHIPPRNSLVISCQKVPFLGRRASSGPLRPRAHGALGAEVPCPRGVYVRRTGASCWGLSMGTSTVPDIVAPLFLNIIASDTSE